MTSIRYFPILLALISLLSLGTLGFVGLTPPAMAAASQTETALRPEKVQAEGARGRALERARHQARENPSAYRSWKRQLPFWPRKTVLLIELAFMITIGILIGQVLEVAGWIGVLSVLAWPLIRLGRLPKAAGPAFIMAFQSGAVANSMLVTYRDEGTLNNRHLYTSVLVVSCLSLFAHLPTFIVPLGFAFGWMATGALFGVRFAAIALEIILVLIVSSWLSRRWSENRTDFNVPAQTAVIEGVRSGRPAFASREFWRKVWKRSQRTLRRLLLYVVPTFVVMALLEQFQAFDFLAAWLPGLFKPSFLPPQSVAIIPAQAVNMYNGAIAAANFIDAGNLTTKQAVTTILLGSVITAPIRTLRHALPTYLATLGARPGTVMAFSAQALRVLFVLLCTWVMVLVW
ncbi:nucleoside recognition protein [Syntrophotalea acetylenivorans]|uniref:nucleoside recognition protein n=1 Tax=Syntrophotalea acetylenivorans TaxID=1842532 RepID=UPI000A69C42A|nr:nucleoside recognition protein [Syntrophotalea acetylenivorans]